MRYRNVRSWYVSSLDILFVVAGVLIGTCARPLEIRKFMAKRKEFLNCSELLNAMRKSVGLNCDRKVQAKVSHKSVDLFIHKARTKIEFCYFFFFASTCICHNSFLHRARPSWTENFRFASIVGGFRWMHCMFLTFSHSSSVLILSVDSLDSLVRLVPPIWFAI